MDKTQVFISYSRKDIAFVERLQEALKARGYEAYLDRTDIAPGEPWKERLADLIAQSDAVVFTMSPSSVASEICAWEVSETGRQGKKLVPVVHLPVPDASAPMELSRINYVFFTQDQQFEQALNTLCEALDTDIAWVREHTRLGEAARQWADRGRTSADVLRGRRLEAAEQWLTRLPKNSAAPTELHRTFILASRKAATSRQRWGILGAVGVALVAAGLGTFAEISRREADKQRQTAESNREEAERQRETAEGNRREAEAQKTVAETERKAAEEQRDQALISQSRFLADAADRATARGDAMSGALIALEGLPDPEAEAQRPYVARTEQALYNAYTSIRELRLLTVHRHRVSSLSVSPDGTKVLSASADGTARLTEVASGKLIAEARGHNGRITSAALSPAGDRILTSSLDGTARISNARTGALILELSGHEGWVRTAVWSPGGDRVATASDDGTARIWDAGSGALLATLDDHAGIVWHVAFDPSGKFIATAAGDHLVRLWNAATAKPLMVLGGHTSIVEHVMFAPDGQTVLAQARDGGLRIWRVATGDLLTQMTEHLGKATTFEQSPGGRIVVTGDDKGELRIWNAETGNLVHVLAGHGAAINRIAFSKSGRYLASSDEKGEIFVWSAESGKLGQRLGGHLGHVGPIAFIGDDLLVSGSMDRSVRLWSLRSPHVRELDGRGGPVKAVAYSRDGQFIAIATEDRHIRIWRAATGELIATTPPQEHMPSAIVFSADGSKLFSSDYLFVNVWEASSGINIYRWKVMNYEAGNLGIFQLTIDPTGAHLAVVGGDFHVHIINAVSGHVIYDIKTKEYIVSNTIFLENGRLITSGFGPEVNENGKFGQKIFSSVRFWDFDKSKESKLIHSSTSIMHLYLSRNKDRFLVADFKDDDKAGVWEFSASDGRFLQRYGINGLKSMSSGPGSDIAIQRKSHGITLRRAIDGDDVAFLNLSAGAGENPVLAFSPTGAEILIGQHDGVARIWPVFSGITDLILANKASEIRALSGLQRLEAFLNPEPPIAVVERKLYPFIAPEWSEWARRRRARQDSAPPSLQGAIGAEVATMSEELASQAKIDFTPGVAVLGLVANASAIQAGLQIGDVITHVEAHPVARAEELVERVRWRGVGRSLTLSVRRFGEDKSFHLMLNRWADDDQIDAGSGPERFMPGNNQSTHKKSFVEASAERREAEGARLGDLIDLVDKANMRGEPLVALREAEHALSLTTLLESTDSARLETKIAAAYASNEVLIRWMIGWNALKTAQLTRAEFQSEKASALSEPHALAILLRAHVLLFKGQIEQARAIYQSNAEMRTPFNNRLVDIVLEDFVSLRKIGKLPRGASEIEAALKAAEDKRRRDKPSSR